MSKFIRLTEVALGRSALFNVDNIMAIRETPGEGGASLEFVGGNERVVAEKPEEIMRLMPMATR